MNEENSQKSSIEEGKHSTEEAKVPAHSNDPSTTDQI